MTFTEKYCGTWRPLDTYGIILWTITFLIELAVIAIAVACWIISLLS